MARVTLGRRFAGRRRAPECRLCGRSRRQVSAAVGVCRSCISERPEAAVGIALRTHRSSRRPFLLPEAPPRTPGGIPCPLCARSCRIGEGELGFCGLRTVRDGRLTHLGGTARRGILHWYRDPLPTNCVADWVCAGSRQRGRHNLAVFYASCTLNCLFCQNWHFRQVSALEAGGMSARELARTADPRTHCVCFFGGDPASQMPHALTSARLLAEQGVTVCWETAGTSNPRLLDHALELSLRTGGCVKFDLKARGEALHRVLTGASNRRTLDNFTRAARRFGERPDPPPLLASTLLVPGYVDPEEVRRIARFIARLDPRIPYSLLGFAPHFHVADLPYTSLEHAEAAAAAAREEGLQRVHIGNRHLLVAH